MQKKKDKRTLNVFIRKQLKQWTVSQDNDVNKSRRQKWKIK